MSGYGRVINGGAQVRTADGGSINNKLDSKKNWENSRQTVATQVLGEFWKQPVPVNSTPKLKGVKDGRPGSI